MEGTDWVKKNNRWTFDENIKTAEQATNAGYDDYKAPGSVVSAKLGDDGEVGSIYLGASGSDVHYVTADNSTKDAINWAATGLMTAGAGLEVAGESHAASLFQQGVRGGVSGNYTLTGRNLSLFGNAAMTSSSAPTSFLSGIGKGVGTVATIGAVGVLGYEGYQFSQGQMDGGRLTYHGVSLGASIWVGAAAGGPAGAVVGLGATGGEMAYDTSKQTLRTLNGQWSNFLQSIINATMGGR
ncbi:hypothetical protein HDC90_005144 [Pedobacter sp. AK013]|uniref:hypothetical protein n=1 Tax=Pedobacter sp. AK013 TaxID=2723071 RepID=UPI00160FE3BF|nr:hypothetical protein [Pedobacter sp. AK013]MBB6240467.1 hypothetical protein [Pedobacter sp. AK013]